MNEIVLAHQRFVNDTIALNKYTDNPLSSLPSAIFLFSSFLIIYSFCHRYTRIGTTSFKGWFYRELTFHWSFFYMSKLWFIFLRGYKISTHYVCDRNVISNDTQRNIQSMQCTFLGLLLLFLFSSMPITAVAVKMVTQPRIPNFFWIGEDPWMHSEIGMAGHYLNRPAPSIAERRDLAYRIKRSASLEQVPEKVTYIRKSKSLEGLKCVQDVSELY